MHLLLPHRLLEPGRLNESPSEKEGKFAISVIPAERPFASMKVPPKRKGNAGSPGSSVGQSSDASMKVPPKRKGNGHFVFSFGRGGFSGPQ